VQDQQAIGCDRLTALWRHRFEFSCRRCSGGRR
jgi:hypothetical protein